MKIITLPVYSRLAAEEEVRQLGLWEKLPTNSDGSRWQLSQHQVDTYRALTTDDVDVVFNTAMTGDGKSLAGQLPALIQGAWSLFMAMYPTNELVQDQKGHLERSIPQWNASLIPGLLNRSALDELMALEDYNQRGDALLGTLHNCDVILTNPDIFHLIMQQFYTRPEDAPHKLIGPLVQKFRQFTFDEFHIFDAPQVISVLNALLFIMEISSQVRPHQFLFLSATPGDLMLEYLHRSGLKVKEIVGQYRHTEAPPDKKNWRPILQQSEIHFEALKNVEEWVELHLEDALLPFFMERRPGAKGAIIVNSVAAAHRLLDRLRPAFACHGLQVEPNTGLTSRARRVISYSADLLIGTSTVDVGVDFQINFLLFESRDAGSFLQRLGRLGRHLGYERDGKWIPFTDFRAYAVTPKWVDEALFTGIDGAAPLLGQEEITDREKLSSAIRTAYPPTATFDAYARLWGKYQSVRVLMGLGRPTVREQYREAKANLQKHYEATFGLLLRPAVRQYKELYDKQRALLDEAISFRGEDHLACCLIDETEQGQDQFKTASLFQVIANARLDYLSEDMFNAAIRQAGLQPLVFSRQQPLAYYRFYGYRQEWESYTIWLDHDILLWGADQFGRALALKGLKINGALPGLSELNNRLSRRILPVLLCAGHNPMDLKRRLRLPLLFSLFEFESRDGVCGSIALQRQALLLESRLAYTRLDCAGGAAIVC